MGTSAVGMLPGDAMSYITMTTITATIMATMRDETHVHLSQVEHSGSLEPPASPVVHCSCTWYVHVGVRVMQPCTMREALRWVFWNSCSVGEEPATWVHRAHTLCVCVGYMYMYVCIVLLHM